MSVRQSDCLITDSLLYVYANTLTYVTHNDILAGLDSGNFSSCTWSQNK